MGSFKKLATFIYLTGIFRRDIKRVLQIKERKWSYHKPSVKEKVGIKAWSEAFTVRIDTSENSPNMPLGFTVNPGSGLSILFCNVTLNPFYDKAGIQILEAPTPSQ
jgi:hypothetical protein